MQKASTFRALMTLLPEAGGFMVVVVTLFGVPIIYLSCERLYRNDAVEKAFYEAVFPVWEKADGKFNAELDIEFRGQIRWTTNKEWRELNIPLSAPICWGWVEIDEVLSVREPVGW
ncbi:MAG: hypothetical protein H8F28_04785 [Fibrella sp.]|nr:hypothetical protein [Armatimonadota bacterium]